MGGFRRLTLPAARRSRGFTLIEMVITVVIATILVALALPSFRELTMRNNVTELNNQLLLALQTARAEAIRRGTWVEVLSGSGTNNWSSGGWKIVADVNFDHVFNGTDLATGLVTTAPPSPTTYTVCGKSTSPTGIGGDFIIVFSPSGALIQSTQFDFNVNRPDGKASMVQHLTISQSGEMKTVRGTTSGAPTSC